MAEEFSVSHRVRLDEVGPAGKWRTDALLAALQDAAACHAAELGFGVENLRRQNRGWLLRRMSLQWRRRPSWRDELDVRTRPAGIRGVQALRDYEVSDSAGLTVAFAASSWLMLDRSKHRPVRLPRDFAALVSHLPPSALSKNPLPLPSRPSRSVSFTVRGIDCDGNQHLNHVRLIETVFSLAGEWGLSEEEISGLEVEFLAQALEGETLSLYISEPFSDSGRLRHLWARREGDSRPAAVLIVDG